MASLNETTNIIQQGSNYIPDISVGFSNAVNSFMVWFNKISVFEWLLLLFVVVMVFVLVGLRRKLINSKRERIRYY